MENEQQMPLESPPCFPCLHLLKTFWFCLLLLGSHFFVKKIFPYSKIKMVRPPCCDKLRVKKGLWTAEEDAKILAYVSKHGTGNWTSVSKKAGLRRRGKSCRPNIRHENFTPQEEMIIRLHAAIGSRWSIIAQQLPGRTDTDVENYWNTRLRKKLCEMGIDRVTHKPFSQILANYGNICGIP